MHTSPVLRSLLLIAMLILGIRQLAGQGQIIPPEIIQLPVAGQPEQPEPPSTTEHLTGVVVSSVDGTPIERALVASNDQRYAAFSDSQGRFSLDFRRTGTAGIGQTFSSFPPGPASSPATLFLTLNVHKPGYVRNTVSFSLSVVQPDSPEPPLTVKLVPTGVITGHVYSEPGDLPDGLIVQIMRKNVNNGRANWLNAGATSPNSRGEFRFANLDPDDYKLLMVAHVPEQDTRPEEGSVPGVLPGYYPSGTDQESAATLTVGPGASVDADLTLHPAPFYDVTIPLAGTARPNIQTFILNAPPGLRLMPNNQSVIGHLPDGTYDVLISSTEPRNTNDPRPLMSDAVVKIEVHGKAVRTAPVALHPVQEIPVEIRREFTSAQPQPNRPPNQQPVFLMLENTRQDLGQPAPSMEAATGDEGLALMGGTPGAYDVNISPNGGGSVYVASATSGTTDLLREPLQIVPNSEPRPIEITLRDDVASIDATLVLDSTMPPLSSASTGILLCIPLDRPMSMPGFALANQAEVTVPNLAPGRYLMLAGRGLFLTRLEYMNPDVLSGLMQKGTVVTLTANQKATVQVPMLPDGDN